MARLAMTESEIIAGAVDALFSSRGLSKFLRDVYPDELLVEHGPLDRLGELGASKIFDHPHELIDRAPDDQLVVYVRSPGGVTQQIAADKQRAKRLYDDGFTVSIEAAQIVHAEVRAWARAFRRELGFAAEVRNVALLLSPPGEAVPMHFDGTEVIIVHMRGCKRWQIAPNLQVKRPDFAYFPGEPEGVGARDAVGRPIDRSFEHSFEWPKEMPASAEVHDLAPGSAAFVPRGFWHQTHAHESTASLTFKVGARTAWSLVVEALERRLRRSDPWRQPVPLWGQREHRERTAAELRELLADLANQIEPSLLLARMSVPKLFRKTGARVRAERPTPPSTAWSLCCAVGTKISRINVDLDPTEFCRVLSDDFATVSEADLANAVPEVNPDGLRALTAALVESGVIEPIA